MAEVTKARYPEETKIHMPGGENGLIDGAEMVGKKMRSVPRS